MSLEEEHETLHRRGEMAKFLILVLTLVGAVFLIALLRPLIFERMVPAIFGWDQELRQIPGQAPGPVPGQLPLAVTPTPEGDGAPVIMTATPPVDGETEDGGAPLPTPRTYAVQQGDTLAQIAVRFGISVEALAQANAIRDPHRIQVGDLLVIPAP